MAVKKCDDIVEVEETTEEAAETTETTETPAPSQVSENVYLGKNITAVESTVYDASSVGLYPVFTFGDGNVTTTRPSDIVTLFVQRQESFLRLIKTAEQFMLVQIQMHLVKQKKQKTIIHLRQ